MLTEPQQKFLKDQIAKFSRPGCSEYMIEIIEIILEHEQPISELIDLSKKEYHHHVDRNRVVAATYWLSVTNSLTMLNMFIPSDADV